MGGGPGSSLTPALSVGAPTSQAAVSAPSYSVQPGDTLWRIADELLGDGAAWTSLAALNLGRDVGGGMRFVDPDRLREGWRLRLPADAYHPDARHPEDDVTRVAGSDRASGPATLGHLPELLALGLGSLACAALARRAGLRRRSGKRFSDDRVPSEGAVDAATLLHHFQGVPALHSFEAANCLLGRALDGGASPTVRAICVSDSGVTFWFAGADSGEPPAGFARVQDGSAWHVGHAALEGADLSFPHLPVVLPIGDDAEGTWLVPLRPGDVLPLLGEAAPALWRGAGRSRVLGLVRDDPGE